MCLTVGGMKNPAEWQETLPLALASRPVRSGRYGYVTPATTRSVLTVIRAVNGKRFDFQDVKIALVDDRWEHDVTETRRPTAISPQTTKALEAVINVVAGGDVVTLPGNRRAVKVANWKAECVRLGLIDAEARPDSARAMFSKFRRELVAANRIGCEQQFSWLR
jgi:hypothetical protein